MFSLSPPNPKASESEQLCEDLSEATVATLADTCRCEGTVHEGPHDQPRVKIFHM